jgi:hypothetical protein
MACNLSNFYYSDYHHNRFNFRAFITKLMIYILHCISVIAFKDSNHGTHLNPAEYRRRMRHRRDIGTSDRRCDAAIATLISVSRKRRFAVGACADPVAIRPSRRICARAVTSPVVGILTATTHRWNDHLSTLPANAAQA